MTSSDISQPTLKDPQYVGKFPLLGVFTIGVSSVCTSQIEVQNSHHLGHWIKDSTASLKRCLYLSVWAEMAWKFYLMSVFANWTHIYIYYVRPGDKLLYIFLENYPTVPVIHFLSAYITSDLGPFLSPYITFEGNLWAFWSLYITLKIYTGSKLDPASAK